MNYIERAPLTSRLKACIWDLRHDGVGGFATGLVCLVFISICSPLLGRRIDVLEEKNFDSKG